MIKPPAGGTSSENMACGPNSGTTATNTKIVRALIVVTFLRQRPAMKRQSEHLRLPWKVRLEAYQRDYRLASQPISASAPRAAHAAHAERQYPDNHGLPHGRRMGLPRISGPHNRISMATRNVRHTLGRVQSTFLPSESAHMTLSRASGLSHIENRIVRCYQVQARSRRQERRKPPGVLDPAAWWKAVRITTEQSTD